MHLCTLYFLKTKQCFYWGSNYTLISLLYIIQLIKHTSDNYIFEYFYKSKIAYAKLKQVNITKHIKVYWNFLFIPIYQRLVRIVVK